MGKQATVDSEQQVASDGEVAIRVENVSKTFKLPHEKSSSLKSAAINVFRRKKGYELQKALSDISFEVKKGEFFGIVGRNGSGKSTLLKLLAGIYIPSSGDIQVKGSLTPFIELGVGFNSELTGRENVYLNGALLGFNRSEMKAMYRDIVNFAELGKFMDQKLKNYSSGMQVRLAFSIAIRAQSDTLLLDEVLAVGDAAFQKKCLDYFKDLKKANRTVILVSHDMDTVEKYCDRVMLIDNGLQRDAGDPREIAAKYRLLNLPEESKDPLPVKLLNNVTINKVTINDKNELITNGNDEIVFEITFTPKKTQNYIVSLSFFRADGHHLAYYDNRKASRVGVFKKGKRYKTICRISAKQFLEGAYLVDVDMYDDNGIYLAHKPAAVSFSTTGDNADKAGLLSLQGQWQVKEK